MQRPAKPSTPVRFRLPPPLSNSSQHSTTSSAGPTPQASEKASLAFADNAKDEAVAVSVAPDLDALGADPLRPYGGSWRATLSFSVASRPYGDGTRSILSNAEHFGPLRLQKPLWPEGRHPVHLLLLHPPGGVAGGDQLHLLAKFEPGTQCLVTTPGAGKFYKADLPSQFLGSFDIDEAGLEWLPQETILQDGAQAASDFEFRLSRGARVIASEILVLGRRDYGETFSRGNFKQSISIRREGRLIFNDATLWKPEFLHQSVSMNQHHVSALFWAARPEAWQEDEVAALESQLDAACLDKARFDGGAICGVSQVVAGLLLIRAMGSTVEGVRRITHQAWAHLRPQIFQRQATLPRIWNT